MNITRTTVPGEGVLFHFATRDGQNLAVMVDRNGSRRILVYGGGDEPSQAIQLAQDEADQIAQVLHSRSVDDRLAILEQRMAEIAGGTP
ncbi:hypothetical protein ACFQVD_10535 [Streptosporangium amethystogenes subsp. fukuiense]|uniref:Potassium/proton antiporter subunit KhtT-like N-terminal domain-containing protein n=1 Tax=Streptosporangium amethystogenes subsp. fukuiense TaxID=698418 RepID=A0ABW2SWM9_9ACTN